MVRVVRRIEKESMDIGQMFGLEAFLDHQLQAVQQVLPRDAV